MRNLTLKTLVCSERHGEARRRRQRRRGPTGGGGENFDSRRTTASPEARLGEDVEEDESKLSVGFDLLGEVGNDGDVAVVAT